MTHLFFGQVTISLRESSTFFSKKEGGGVVSLPLGFLELATPSWDFRVLDSWKYGFFPEEELLFSGFSL